MCVCLGSVNEWIRRKGEDGLGGGVYVGWDGALMGWWGDGNRFTAND